MEEKDLIENIKQLSEQIKKDDLEENPDSAYEQFQCDCCGEVKMLAGSLPYETYRLCNDCVIQAELGFATEKLSNIRELIDSMEDKRFNSIYNDLFTVEDNSMN